MSSCTFALHERAGLPITRSMKPSASPAHASKDRKTPPCLACGAQTNVRCCEFGTEA
jgi:hypothetical protein